VSDDAAQPLPLRSSSRPLRTAPLDAVDRALIEALQENGRASFRALGRTIGITEKTARRRLLSLIDDGVIVVTAVTNPALLGYRAAAMLGVSLDGTRTASSIATDLARIVAVDYIVVSTGRFSLLVELLCTDRIALLDAIEREVRSIDGVRHAEPFPYLSIYYQQARFAVARAKSPAGEGIRPGDLDALDRCIIRALTLDGRASFQAIAGQLGVSEAVIRQRVRQLLAGGVAQVIAIVNPLGLGYATTAWLAIRVAAGHRLTDLGEALARLPFVTYIAICTGRFDIYAEVVCRSEGELLALLDDEIRMLPGLADVEVAIALELHYKHVVPPVPHAHGS
jgi:Lrp/AsnC family transcriptional regulator for asnA, asnC and gidA